MRANQARNSEAEPTASLNPLNSVPAPFDLLLPRREMDVISVNFEPMSNGFVGRPALCNIPGVLEYIEDVLFQTSAAQNRRRTHNKTTIGISLSDLNERLKDLFPEVRKFFPNLSNDTIRRLGEPPHKGYRTSGMYHSLLPMKQMNLDNSQFHFTDSAHDSFCQVSYICEPMIIAKG